MNIAGNMCHHYQWKKSFVIVNLMTCVSDQHVSFFIHSKSRIAVITTISPCASQANRSSHVHDSCSLHFKKQLYFTSIPHQAELQMPQGEVHLVVIHHRLSVEFSKKCLQPRSPRMVTCVGQEVRTV